MHTTASRILHVVHPTTSRIFFFIIVYKLLQVECYVLYTLLQVEYYNYVQTTASRVLCAVHPATSGILYTLLYISDILKFRINNVKFTQMCKMQKILVLYVAF